MQLDAVTANALSPINLEDFPLNAAAAFRGQIPGLTLRRAFRYSDTAASLSLKASAVEPDVRVETRDTLSLGEDHTTLADSFTADITRAGIFNLSFVMPEGFDVDSISGAALSQWTEFKTNDGRVITLHLSGKTLGRQEFAITLAGPGVKTARGWKVPQVVVREAGKQRGTLLIVPEQGMGLQAAAREGYTQLDPQKSGIRQKGVLAFSLLQVPSNLTLDIDQVDPWIEVTSLQHAAIGEAQDQDHGQFAVSDQERRAERISRLPSHQRRERALPGRAGGRFPQDDQRHHQWIAGMGSQTGPPRHRPVSAASDLSNPHPRPGGGDDPGGRAGRRGEFADGIRHRAIRPAPASDGGRSCRRPCNRPNGRAFRACWKRTWPPFPPASPTGCWSRRSSSR